MRLSLAFIAPVIAVAAALTPSAASAQARGSWFFCYVDPPTYNSGIFVYTRTNYVGRASIPLGEIAAAMAAVNPQVSGRQPTCWRYSTQEEAESRRAHGMSIDRNRGYTIREIDWTSRFTPETTPPAEEVAAPADVPAPAAAATAEKAPAPQETSKTTAETAPKEPTRPRMSNAEADAKYAREMEIYRRQKAENEQQRIDYAKALQQHQADVDSVAARAEAARKKYDEERAKWMADVEACKAGDYSRCGSTQPQ